MPTVPYASCWYLLRPSMSSLVAWTSRQVVLTFFDPALPLVGLGVRHLGDKVFERLRLAGLISVEPLKVSPYELGPTSWGSVCCLKEPHEPRRSVVQGSLS